MMSTHPSTGPHRVLRAAAAGLRLLFGTAGLALVTVGIPWLLVRFVGNPNPWRRDDGWGSPGQAWDNLSQPLEDDTLIRLLALIAWICWCAFVLNIVGELWWYARRLPALAADTGARAAHAAHLAELPAHRMVAAVLVGGLMLTILAMWRTGTAVAAPTTPQHTQRPPGIAQAATIADRHTPPATSKDEHPTTARATPAGAPVPHTVRKGDTLWDIAADRLGDPLRWPEIYKLSKTLPQPDGERLTDPDVIEPDWVLHLPADATVPEAQTPPTTDEPPTPEQPTTPAPPPNAQTPPPVAEPPAAAPETPQPPITGEPAIPAPPPQAITPQPPPITAPPPSTAPPTDAAPTTVPAAPQRDDTDSGRPVGIDVGEAGFIGVTLAAGIAAALVFARAHRRRRHRIDDPGPPPLDGIVRAAQHAHLWTRTAAGERPTPTREHSTPHDSTALTEEPPRRRPAPAEPAPPGTINIGAKGRREITVWEATNGGGLGLTGPGATGVARAVAMSVLTAAERTRPAPAPVHLLLTADDAADLLPGYDPATATRSAPLLIVDDLDHALDEAERHVLGHHHDRDETDDTRPEEPEPLPTLILLTTADPTRLPRLRSVAAHGTDGGVAVLTLGPWPGATCHIQDDGTLTRSERAVGPPVRFFHLAPDHLADLIALLHTARGRVKVGPLRGPARRPTRRTPPPGPTALPTAMTRTTLGPGRRTSVSVPVSLPTRPTPTTPDPATDTDETGDDSEHPHNSSDLDAEPTFPTEQPANTTTEPATPENPDHRDPTPDRPLEQPNEPPTADEHQPATQATAPPRPTPHGTPAPALRLRVLGPFGLDANGIPVPLGPTLKEGVREFLALLAAHPNGVRVDEISDSLNLPTDPEETKRELANIRRSAHRLLGRTGPRSAQFFTRSGDRYRLHPREITSDLAEFTTALRDAAHESDPQARAALRSLALKAYGGPYLDGSTYPFADETREALAHQAIDTRVRLAEHHAAHGHTEQALGLLHDALIDDPANEELAQHTIRLQLAAGRRDAATRTLTALRRALAAIEAEPEPATLALLSEPADGAEERHARERRAG
ncbi:BTAD domain-containing putative transcriptional regulator [Embleya sp. NPDC008237]|uniref:BTAD domain-containing putative transcriptional regulator n=1 Tax=Embleya sp. NPDC008237 TaxID=3363978 RepID=UPI0036F0838C